MWTVFDRLDLIECVASHYKNLGYKVSTILDRKEPPDIIAWRSKGKKIVERYIIECGRDVRDAIYRILRDMSSPRPTLKGEYCIAVPLEIQDEIPEAIFKFGINVIFISNRFLHTRNAILKPEKACEYIHIRVTPSTKKLWEQFSKTFKTKEEALLWLLRTKMIYRFIRPTVVL